MAGRRVEIADMVFSDKSRVSLLLIAGWHLVVTVSDRKHSDKLTIYAQGVKVNEGLVIPWHEVFPLLVLGMIAKGGRE